MFIITYYYKRKSGRDLFLVGGVDGKCSPSDAPHPLQRRGNFTILQVSWRSPLAEIINAERKLAYLPDRKAYGQPGSISSSKQTNPLFSIGLTKNRINFHWLRQIPTKQLRDLVAPAPI